MAIQRQVAKKVWLSQISNSTYVKQEGWDPNYIEVNGDRISRINIIATVVGRFLSDDGNYGALTLDDSSDTIRVKAFGPDVRHVKNTKPGDLIRIIGKIKQYNEETYIAPEAIRVETDPNWMTIQRIELGKIPEVKQETLVKEEVKTEKKEEPKETPKIDIVEIVKKLDKGEGVDIKEVIKETKLEEPDAKELIAEKLASGDIFEPKKGVLKPL